ncbi:MAG TPA: A/G-specific adenine glycosylase, partial [Prevotella sp.]|nr:A/G-specific adenine glycosylase [Prevotella sp.]
MSPAAFCATLLRWYEANGRDLPWRHTRDPYAIWLSEVILQQTRISQGTAYWLRFMQAWPTVEALATATEDEVLKMWQGLGYYLRARNLHTAARQIVA